MFTPTDKDRDQVKAMAIAGIQQELMGKILGISVPTLTKYFAEELEQSLAKANSNVVRNLLSKATGNGPSSVTAAIWWTKSRMGWSERQEIGGIDGGPIKIVVAKDDFAL
jgi:hypothetical protein